VSDHSLLLLFPPSNQPLSSAFLNETILNFSQRSMAIFIQTEKPVCHQSQFGGVHQFRHPFTAPNFCSFSAPNVKTCFFFQNEFVCFGTKFVLFGTKYVLFGTIE
jgi:hypothetical protein